MERLAVDQPLPDRLRGGIIVLGKFDGFHRGHQAVVSRARARAGAEGRPLVIVTLEPHPIRFYDPTAAPFRLTLIDQLERHCRRAGADAMVVIGFDDYAATLMPEDFVAEKIVKMTAAATMVTGVDFSFGAPRAVEVEILRRLAARHSISIETVRPVSDGGGLISSDRIRQKLREGDCEAATLMMGRPFSVRGVVVRGNQIGRTIGFPTANLRMNEYLRPRYGVYAVRGRLPGGRVIDGVANLGIRPMIEPPEELFEPHFLEFTGDLYDQVIDVELIRWMRGEAKLANIAELQGWINRDCEEARAILDGTPRGA